MRESTPDTAIREPGPLGRNAAVVAAVIVGFSVLHFGLRALVTPSVHGDDADLIVFDQSLQWGYHAQPPLYSWLYRGVTACVGRNLLALNLLRTALVAATAWWMYLAVRYVVRDERLRSLGAYSALATPVVAWHAVTYLTHSLLVCLACLAALHAALRVAARARWGDYVWLGVVSGLGLLSKYNFAVFAVALVVGGLAVAPLRRRLLDKRMLVTVAIAAAILAPHAWWLVENVDAIRGEYDHKLAGAGSGVGFALVDLAKNLLLVAAPTVAIFAGCFPMLRKSVAGGSAGASGFERWVFAYFAAFAAIYAVCIVATGATRFHERWLEPLFLLAPIALLSRVDRLGPSSFAIRRYGATLAVLALVMTGVRAGQAWVGNSHRGYISMDYSYAAAAETLSEADAVVVVVDHSIGGNLINCDPRLACVAADHSAYQPAWSKQADDYVLVWSTKHGEETPERLREFAIRELGLPPLDVTDVRTLAIDPLYEGQQSGELRYVTASRPRRIAADTGHGQTR